MAQLRRLKEQFPNELVIIGVHSAKFPTEHQTESIRQAALRLGIEHPVLNDAEFKTWNAYNVRAWPTLVLIDPRGRVVGEFSGEVLAEELAPEIEALIREHESILNRDSVTVSPAALESPSTPLRFPARVLASPNRLFIADSGHHRIVEVRLDAGGMGGEVSRIIGSGEPGLQDGDIATALFNHPHGLAVEGDTLYVADTGNHAVRAVDLAAGEVRTLAGTGQKAHRSRDLAAPLETPLRSPWAVLPLDRYLLIAMAGSHQIWVLIEGEQLGPFAGNGAEDLVDGPVAQGSFNQPSDLAFGMGHLFVADPEASAVRAISLDEQPRVFTLAGQGLFEFGDRDGKGPEVRLQHPAGLSFESGTLFIADTYNHKIKTLDPLSGEVRTLAGGPEAGSADGDFQAARFDEPEGVSAAGSLLYAADTNNHLIRVLDLDERRVQTFNLRGLSAPSSHPGRDKALRLEPQVAAPGMVRLVLEPRLPPGTKRNPDQPSLLKLAGRPLPPARIPADQPLALAHVAQADEDLRLELTLYYCDEGDTGLCYVRQQVLILPLKVRAGGPETVTVQFSVPASSPL